jgi:hypothetical protein
MITKKQRIPKYRDHILTSIDAAKLSIEMFNRVDAIHSRQASIIFNAQAWELFAKGILIKNKVNIFNKDGTSLAGEISVHKLFSRFHILKEVENQTIQQVFSLRNEAMHHILSDIPDEILTHLMYFSLKIYHQLLKQQFPSYFKNFDKNYLSISFKENTHYSHRVKQLYAFSKKAKSPNNHLLYLLDRACKYGSESDDTVGMVAYADWQKEIKSKSKKARISKHLSIYDYTQVQDDVRFIPLETPKGHGANIEVRKAKKQSEALSVLIKRSNPETDYPFLTSDIARLINQSTFFVTKLAEKLKFDGNAEFKTIIKTGKSSTTKKYSNKALERMRAWLEVNQNWSPYKAQ